MLLYDVNMCTHSYVNAVPCVFDVHTCVFMDIVVNYLDFLNAGVISWLCTSKVRMSFITQLLVQLFVL